MKLGARKLAWLLPLLLSACAHNVNQAQMQALAPPIEDTPPPPDLAPNALPQPQINIPQTPEPVAVQPPPKPTPKHHKSKPAATSPANAAIGQQPPQVAAEAAPEVSATGNFATSSESSGSKKQAEDAIDAVEKGLNGIGRKLNDQEEKTSMQIKEYLKQARAILSSGDVVGAEGLAIKAKALLGELSQ